MVIDIVNGDQRIFDEIEVIKPLAACTKTKDSLVNKNKDGIFHITVHDSAVFCSNGAERDDVRKGQRVIVNLKVWKKLERPRTGIIQGATVRERAHRCTRGHVSETGEGVG